MMGKPEKGARFINTATGKRPKTSTRMPSNPSVSMPPVEVKRGQRLTDKEKLKALEAELQVERQKRLQWENMFESLMREKKEAEERERAVSGHTF